MTVPLSEVWENADAWRPSFQYEYDVLVRKTVAVVPTKRHLLAPGTELVPEKMVCCKKGGTGAKRSRAVICGNLASEQADPPPGGLPGGSYASGADGVLIRASLLEASQDHFIGREVRVSASSSTTSTSWQARGRSAAEGDGGLGVCEPDEVWLIRKALYGFNTSPSYWAIYRDQVLQELAWEDTTTSPTT